MEIQEIAERLLWPIWRGMPDGYKKKYARTVWAQFEDQVRSSAYTSSLPRFVENICRRLQVDWANASDAASAAGFIEMPPTEARDVLNTLRSEATAAVLLVRLKNELRKADYQAKQETRRKEEEQANADVLV